jgi:ABC-type lipoprotein export system ATPase subunit
VILADEPTGNLDTVTAERIFHIFEKLVDQGKTLILVTHDSNMASRFSRVVGISDGEIVSDLEGDGRAHENPQRLEDHPGMKAVSKETRPSHVSVPGNGRGAAKELSMPKANTEPQVSTDKGNASELDAAFAAAAATESLPKKKGKSWALPRIMPGSNGTKNRQAISPQNGPAILLQDVVKTYVNAAGQFTALKGVNLAMDYGQFISIVGKSGSGKSTLLNMLTGIDHPTSGEVIVGGQNIYQMSESRRALWRGRNVGIVFQFFQLIPTLTLLENTMLPMDYCDIYRSRERPERALELLRMVGLADQADKLPSSVSSGQQQSAAIARALATDPPIIVADEPTGNLDSRSAENILQLFSRLAKGGKTILIVTHDPSFTSRTDQTVILSDGEIIDDAVARALPLLNHPQMLQATHQAEKRAYAPGSVIIRQGERVEYFFMISKGEVDILLKRPDCQEITLARMGQGQFFGEIELIHSENSVASVRAAGEEPAELTLLPRDEFYRLLRDAPLTQNFVEKVADARLEENQAHNNGCEEE